MSHRKVDDALPKVVIKVHESESRYRTNGHAAVHLFFSSFQGEIQNQYGCHI